MSENIIVALISAFVTVGNVVFTTLMSHRKKANEYTAEQRRMNDELRENIASGVQCLLRMEIIRSHEEYSNRGYCPIYAKENLTKAYTAYHNLGGNDVATSLYKACILLPDKPRGGENDED